MGKEIVSQVKETQRIPDKINPGRNTLRYINQTNLNTEKNIKSNNIQGNLIRLSADFLVEIGQARKE